jgi:hypothetical protein
MKMFLDNFTIYSSIEDYIPKLWLCFIKCWEYGISLNLEKCLLMVFSNIILDHVVSNEGKMQEPQKIKVIQDMP